MSRMDCTLRIAALVSCLAIGGLNSAERDPGTGDSRIRVMPLGDSITQAESGRASYRYWLWKRLEEAGIDVDFVGSQRGVHGGDARFADFDQDHEGHWGLRADEVYSRVVSSARIYEPDIVLIHLGTNDVYAGETVQGTVHELGQVIEALRRHNPTVTVMLSRIIPARRREDEIRVLNRSIVALAQHLDTAESPVAVVDHWDSFDLIQDTYDGVHPNESGERKMADRWFYAMTRAIRDSDS